MSDMPEDMYQASVTWATNLAAANGFVVGELVKSQDGLFYSVEGVGFGGDEALVSLKLVGQPNAPVRTVTVRERQSLVIW